MYHFIANPNARSGQGLALWEKIKLKLIAEHIDYQIHFTHHRQFLQTVPTTFSGMISKTVSMTVLIWKDIFLKYPAKSRATA
jgi:diacylglycerol kinase family enzyme